MGIIYQKKGELDCALEYQLKSEEINIDTLDDDLIERLSNEDLTKIDTYENAKYLFINNYELEELSLSKLSNIIENKTLIISFIEDMSNISKLYSNNKYLCKLFLFNILKNDEYIDFIMNQIIKNDSYDGRIEFMSIDIDNIYNNCNIFKHYFETLDNSKKIIKKYDNELSTNKYKMY